MAVNKKAFFFTFASVILVSIFVLVFTRGIAFDFEEQTKLTKTKVNILQDYTHDLQARFTERITRTAAVKALEVIMNGMETKGEYLEEDGLNKIFKEAAGYGSYRRAFSLLNQPADKDLYFNLILTNVTNNEEYSGFLTLPVEEGYEFFVGKGPLNNDRVLIQEFPVQSVYNEEDWLEKIKTDIKKLSLKDLTGTILLLTLYNGSGNIMAQAKAIYEEDGELEFPFNNLVQLEQGEIYKLILTAPFLENGDGGFMFKSTKTFKFGATPFSAFKLKIGTANPLAGNDVSWPVDELKTKSINFLYHQLMEKSEEDLRINSKIGIKDIVLTQDKPFYIKAIITTNIHTEYQDISYTINDYELSVDIPIEGLRNPVHAVEGIGPEKVYMNVTDHEWHLALTKGLLDNAQFRSIIGQDIPCYIDRFEKKEDAFSQDCGIEALVKRGDALSVDWNYDNAEDKCTIEPFFWVKSLDLYFDYPHIRSYGIAEDERTTLECIP